MSKPNTRLTKNQLAKIEAEQKEQDRMNAQFKKQKEDEQKKVQEMHDMHEFQTMPRTNLNLKSVYGLNDNLRVNEAQVGTSFAFLKSPGGETQGKPSEDVQLLSVSGRQLAIRNALTNGMHMIKNENKSHQITAIATMYCNDQCRIAMAESDFFDPSQLYFSIYEVGQGNQYRLLQPRVKIEMPQSDPNESERQEEVKAAGGRRCEQHGRTKDFSSAAASSAHKNNAATMSGVGGKPSDQPSIPFVSQICFSGDFTYVACLISGSVNCVVVYEIKAGKVKTVAMENFNLIQCQYQDEVLPSSPTAGDQSRVTDKSKLSTRYFYLQIVTQISFNPCHSLSLCMTGPDLTLEYKKILIGRHELEPIQDPTFAEMKQRVNHLARRRSPRATKDAHGNIIKLWNDEDKLEASRLPPSRFLDQVCISSHSWSSDGEYFGFCTEDAQIVVYKCGTGIAFHADLSMRMYGSLVSIKMHEQGFVVISNGGHMFFFEVDDESQFQEIRAWKYSCDELRDQQEGFDDVIRGMEILDDDNKMLAVQLSNRNVLLIDIDNEVYCQDKRDDIAMKLKEQQEVENSPEEKNRYKSLSRQDQIKCDDVYIKERVKIQAIGFKMIGNGAHSGPITEMHTCMQRPIILTMSYEDQTIRLWNYVDNQCELTQNFALGLGEQKPLQSCALHPSGYYMAVALADQIRLYHILHPDLKQFNSYEQKNTKCIRFSSGGQYFCAIDHKQIHIFSTYSLEIVRNLQIPPTTISTIAFNFNDSRIGFVSGDGQMQCFNLEDFSRLGELRNDRAYAYSNAMFVSHNDRDDNQLIVVGTKKEESASLRIFDSDEMTLSLNFKDEITDPENALCFTDVVKVVTAENLVQNIIIGTNRGSLLVHGMPPKFLREDPTYRYSEMIVHQGEVTALRATEDGRYVFSAGEDGCIFMYECEEFTPDQKNRRNMASVSSSMPDATSVISNGQDGKRAGSNRDEMMNSATQRSQAETVRESGNTGEGGQAATTVVSKKGIEIQDELARIVLVGKGLMEDWRKEQETLRTEMEKQQNIVDSSLREENFSFIKRNNAMEKETTKQLNDLNRAYEELQMEEAEQKDDNQQQMNKLEINHNQCKEELQDLYDKKYEYEVEQTKLLKEAQNEEKMQFEAEIKRLNDCHDADVEGLLDDFKERLQDVQGMYEDSKKVADDLKMKNEEKLTSQEQDQLQEIQQLTSMHKEVMDKLSNEIFELKNEIEREKYHENKIRTEIVELKKKTDTIKHITEKYYKQGKDFEKQIKDLDQDKKDATANLKKKEDELLQQKFKIKDLQKTKQVLTHRTFEMKASLEPKEQQIESLKQNLHDLEKLFDMQAKSLHQMEQNVRGKEESKVQLVNKHKQAKAVTKKQEQKIQEFVTDIQKTMQKSDDADKLQGFMQIYTEHVKKQSEEVMTKKQKDPELIDQLDKHLKYMEKQIRQLTETSSKKAKKAKDHIHQRTDENKNLIVNLEELRGKDKVRKSEQNAVDKKITEILLAKRRIDSEIARMEEEIKKMRLTEPVKPGITKTSSVYTREKGGDDKVADQFRRSQSRGKLIKGSSFINRPVGLYKQQINELMGSLDDANEMIVMQNLQITTLRDEFEAARRSLLEGIPDGQQPSDLQRQQFAQLRSELENLQVLSNSQQQLYMAANQGQAPVNQMDPNHFIDQNRQGQDVDGQPLN